MSNVLFSPLPLHERYDLKGSILGRVTKEPSDFRKSELVMKDLDLLSSGAKLCMPPRAYKETEGRLERDVAFLRSIGVMDYSLLVGIHFRGQGIPGFNRLLNLIARHKNRAIFGRRRAFYHLGIIDFLQPVRRGGQNRIHRRPSRRRWPPPETPPLLQCHRRRQPPAMCPWPPPMP